MSRNGRRTLRRGWSILEMLVVTLVMGILATLYLGGVDDVPTTALEDNAHFLAHSITAAREEAVLSAGEAHIRADLSGGSEGRGRFQARRLAVGQTWGNAEAGMWVDFPRNVGWGSGPASVGPMGDDIEGPAPLSAIVCGPTGDCALGGVPVVTYYMHDLEISGAVRAVTLTESGQVRVWRFDRSEGTWR